MCVLKVEAIQSPQVWETYRSDWNQLAADNLCRQYDWMKSWWDANHRDYRLSILRASFDGTTIAFFPLVRHHTFLHGETLCFLGNGKACSDDLGILVSDENALAAAITFSDYFRNPVHRSERWDHFDLDGIRSGSKGMELFLEHLTTYSRVRSERRKEPNCWELDVRTGWDMYLKRVSKRVRKMWKQTDGYLKKESRFEVAESLDQALDFASKIADLHQSRWATKGIIGCFGSSRFTEFLFHAIEAFWNESDETERPVVGHLTIEGKSAGGSISFCKGGILHVYLTGMNPDLESYRPGWQTSFCTIQAGIQRGCHTVDFMRGDEAYKPRLEAKPTEQERWIIASPRFVSQVRNSAYYAALGVKNWTQAWLHSPESTNSDPGVAASSSSEI